MMSRRSYGSPRVHAELVLGQDLRCSRKRVARLMRRGRIAGIHRRKKEDAPDGILDAAPAQDLVQRSFNPTSRIVSGSWTSSATRRSRTERRCKTFSTGPSQRPGEAGGSPIRETPGRTEAAPTTTERASTARWFVSGKQGRKVYVRNQRLNAPQESHRLESGGSGPGSSAHLRSECAGNSSVG